MLLQQLIEHNKTEAMDPTQINLVWGWQDSAESRDWFESTYLPWLVKISLQGNNVRTIPELDKIVTFIVAFQK